MNPFLEILDSLIESFSAILGRQRAVKPTRAEELERPADLPGSEPEPTAEDTEASPEGELPEEGEVATPGVDTAQEASQEPEILDESTQPEALEEDRPGDMPPGMEEPAGPTAEEPAEGEEPPQPRRMKSVCPAKNLRNHCLQPSRIPCRSRWSAK